MDPERIALIIAAGAGRRMGTPKALLQVEGTPLLIRVARAYGFLSTDSIHAIVTPEIAAALQDAGVDDAGVEGAGVEGAGVEGAPTPPVIPAQLHTTGVADAPMMDSVRAALALWSTGSAEEAFLQPVDAGSPKRPVLEALLAQDPAYAAVKPTHQGRGGHPLLLRRHFLDAVSWRQCSSLRDALAQLPQEQLRRVEVDDPHVLRNWNRPEDLG